MPKVGRIAALDVPGRSGRGEALPFSPRKLVGYSGLAPTVRQQRRADRVRLDQPGGSARVAGGVGADRPPGGHRHSEATQPLRTWFNRVASKRGKKTAMVALATAAAGDRVPVAQERNGL